MEKGRDPQQVNSSWTTCYQGPQVRLAGTLGMMYPGLTLTGQVGSPNSHSWPLLYKHDYLGVSTGHGCL